MGLELSPTCPLFAPRAPDQLLSSARIAGTSQLPEQLGGLGQEGEMRVAKAAHTWAGSMAALWRRPPGALWLGVRHRLLGPGFVFQTLVYVICTSSNSSVIALPPNSPRHHLYFLLPNTFLPVCVSVCLSFPDFLQSSIVGEAEAWDE